jgi:hypothetical protein
MVKVYPFWLVDVCEMQRFTHFQELKTLSPLVQAKEKNPMSQTIQFAMCRGKKPKIEIQLGGEQGQEADRL